MARSYTTISEHQLGNGIDQRSSENLLAPGFSQDILNGDTLESRVLKRVGYQGHAGNIPVRVISLEYDNTDDTMTLELDDSIDLLSVPSSPLVIYGRSSGFTTGQGPFTTDGDTLEYYQDFIVDPRHPISGDDFILIPADESGLTSSDTFIGVVASTSDIDFSHKTFIPDDVRIDLATLDVTVDYTDFDPDVTDALVYFLQRDPVTGIVYHLDYIYTGPSGPEVQADLSTVDVDAGTDIRTITIPAATHNLNNLNIIPEFYEIITVGPQVDKYRVIPDTMVIDNATGDVTVTFENSGSLSSEMHIILSAAPANNIISGQTTQGNTESVSLELDGKFPFVAAYVQVDNGGAGENHLIYPDLVEYDDDIADGDGVRDLTVEFTNTLANSSAFEVYYEFGNIISNKITIPAAGVGTSGTDLRPQLTIWGLDHSEIYAGATDFREGWATHIDSYRRSSERRLVTGLGGNLFRALTYAEAGSQYGYQSLYPRLRSRIDGDTDIAPLFSENTQSRSQGYLQIPSTGLGNWLKVTDIAFDTGSGYVDYTLEAANHIEQGTLASMYTSGVDQLTVNNSGLSKHNGTFTIQSITSVNPGAPTGTLVIRVSNPLIDSTDWDESNLNGRAAVFTDFLPLTLTSSSNPYLPRDTLGAGSLDETDLFTVLSPAATGIHIDGVVEEKTLASNLRTVGSREDYLIPLRNISGLISSADNYVRGDMVRYTGIDRLLRVNYVTPHVDRNITITVVSELATVEITSGDSASFLSSGQRVAFTEAGSLSGTWQISQVLDTTKYTIEMPGVVDMSLSGIQIGNSIEVDEPLPWADVINNSTSVTVEERWIPIEAPDDNFALTPSTYIHHFDSADYVEQSYLRSAMSNNNLYLTNGNDEVMKFDGTNIYRAGLFRWQPGLFATVDEDAVGKIVIPNISIESSDATVVGDNHIKVDNGDASTFSVGEQFLFDGNKYTITNINSPANGVDPDKIFVSPVVSTVSGAGETLSQIAIYTYYFRLNAIDANNNQIASAVTGANDFVVEIGVDAAINIKMIGMPAWDNYDYDRLEVEIYRTKSNQAAPFYRIATLPMSFNNGDGYLDYNDTSPDEILTALDPVNTALLGAEIGTTWSEPMRAKYITSAGNRLILSNLTDYPQVDIQIEDTTANTINNFLSRKYLFRKDSDDPSSVVNMTDVAAYGFSLEGTSRTRELTGGMTTDTDTLQILTSTTGFSVGNWIYLYHGAEDRTLGSVTFSDGGPELEMFITSYMTRTGDSIYFSGGTMPNGIVEDKIYEVGTEVVTDLRFHLIDPDTGLTVNYTGPEPGGSGSGVTAYYAGSRSLEYSGWYQISEIVSGSQMNVFISGLAADPDRDPAVASKMAWALDKEDVPVLLGEDLNRGTKFGNSDVSAKTQVMNRLGEAINASMRMTNISLPGQEDFTPWIIANSGGEFSAGQLIVRQPKITDSVFEVELPTSYTNFRVAVNGVFRDPGTTAGAIENVYPSRVVQSYTNFPEIFDNQRAVIQQDSDSIIDVNTSDGQQITGTIPFFGESVTSAAQLEGIVLVSKENSIYVYNTENRTIQKLETQGLGCTAPYSLAVSKAGINFANEAGVYQIDRSMRMQYLGRYVDRLWTDNVNRDRLSELQGHTFSIGKQYKLSHPVPDATVNSEVLVYDYGEGESSTDGSWTRYDNHPATGWANLDQDAFFSTSTGRVMSIRRTGTDTDYRDDSSPISFEATLRAMDFGDAAIRKTCIAIITHLRAGSATEGTKLLVSRDLSEDFEETTGLTVTRVEAATGIDDKPNKAVITLRSATERTKFVYIQLKYTNSSADEPVEIVGVDFRVSGMSRHGTTEAIDV